MTSGTVETRIMAFLDGEDSLAIPNIIHSTEGAQAYGYAGALVGGVTVYSWAVSALIEALGERWLRDGWVDVFFKRPVYPGDAMTTRVEPEPDGSVRFQMLRDGAERCVEGMAGLGGASWFGDLQQPAARPGEPAPPEKPRLTPEIVPLGEDLRPMAVSFSTDDAEAYADTRACDPHPRWLGQAALLHPGWIAAQATPLIRHSYAYGPAIHARSQIQHLRPVRAGQTLTVTGHVGDAYERKGHHYLVVDCAFRDERGDEFTRLRHTTIYQVAKR